MLASSAPATFSGSPTSLAWIENPAKPHPKSTLRGGHAA